MEYSGQDDVNNIVDDVTTRRNETRIRCSRVDDKVAYRLDLMVGNLH